MLARSMRRSRTYVVQVSVGREQKALDLIRRMVPANFLQEAFLPMSERKVRHGGDWQTVESLLVPGYLYVITSNVDALAEELRKVPALTRLLGTEEHFHPLTNEELAWMQALTAPESRTVPMSTGIMMGDAVRILSGPLVGYEAQIVKIDRHRRTAEIRFRIMGRDTRVRVGLEVVSGQ